MTPDPWRLRERVLAFVALSAATLRLLSLGWLHPLNYDELEFFTATEWVRRGLLPYRDFWEHHTPLQWYLFAPFVGLTRSEGVDAVIFLRWAQVVLWIATFWLANVWMRRLGLSRVVRLTALAIVLSSSFLMIPAVEYRVDVLGCTLYLAALALAMRMSERRIVAFAAGIVFVLAGLANVRLGALLATTVLLLRVVDPDTQSWRGNRRANWLLGGVLAGGALALAWFAGTGSLRDLYQQVWVENYLNDRWAAVGVMQFRHRLVVTLGLHLLGTRWSFEPETIDPGGVALLALGAIGLVRAMASWRRPDWRFVSAVLQVVSILFVAKMKHVYNYHFEIVAMMMLPFIADSIERTRRRELAVTIVVSAWSMGAFASVFRGKEADRSYQDLIMREVHRRTLPGEKVWEGAPWAIRREPAYRFWFLPGLVTELVSHGVAEPYRVANVMRDPPAAIVVDYAALKWLGGNRELRQFLVRHYLPVWRNLWIPAPNGVLSPERPQMSWLILRDGEYRVFASEVLVRHPWFRTPLVVSPFDRPDAAEFPLRLGVPVATLDVAWNVDFTNGRARLRRGQRITATLRAGRTVGVLLVPGADEVLFCQPLPGVTLEASYPRQTHVPSL